MSNDTNSHFPNLGKLSIAIIENWAEPVIGKEAISEIKSPLVEKQLRDAISEALTNTEKRFIKEHSDREVCEAIINLPLANLPSVIQAARNFYSSPTDTALEKALNEQLTNNFASLSPERLTTGVSSYLNIFRQELALLSSEIREKLNTNASLSIQKNTERIANNFEQLLLVLSQVSTYNNEQKYKQKIYFALRRSLKERKDIRILHDAVHEAEALYSEGKLPDELVELLGSARYAFDEIRRLYGEITTAMRSGNLRDRKLALDTLIDRLVHGETYCYDFITLDFRPITEIVREAQENYEMASADTAQYTIEKAEKTFKDYPFGASALLRESLNEPFLDEHRRLLENKLQEIEYLINKQEQSAKLFVERNLNSQEREIVELAITKKWSSHQIATDLKLSPAYVDIQLQQICEKLQNHFGLEKVNITTLTTLLGGYWWQNAG